MKRKAALLIACVLFFLSVPCKRAFAAGATDEILNYTITVDVNEDATLNMVYHIDWEVLDSDELGPLSWVQVGIPNSHYVDYGGLSDTVNRMQIDSSMAKIYLDRDYYEGEIASFDFFIEQDYMYEMNVLTEGESVFYFVPGWFDGIEVDNIVIDWNIENAIGWSHGAVVEGDRLIWSGSLSAGEQFDEVSVTYNNDAFAFDEDKMADKYDYDDYSPNYSYNYDNNYYDSSDDGDAIIGLMFFIVLFVGVGKLLKKSRDYESGSGLGSGTTKRKVTRTLIKYYPTCPGCGAVRAEDQEKCEYCGRSFIESEEVVEEKEIKEPSKYNNEGTFRYGDSGNTYIRVHVTHVPVPRPSSTRSSCAHSSCAHSSCACAHSCACACACACAGGGRAGCSTKDFYNTGLKLSQLERKAKKK